MALTIEEQEYLQKHPMCVKLTNDPDHLALWQTLYGARTLSDALETEHTYAVYNKRLAEEDRNRKPYVSTDWSEEMERRHQRCIDEFGCGMFGD